MDTILRKPSTRASYLPRRLVKATWWLTGVAAVAFGIWWLNIDRPVEIQTVASQIEEISGTFTSEGVVRGKEYDLATEVSGRIIDLQVREGDSVAKDALILKIDSQDLQKALNEAYASTKAAVMESSRAGATFGAAKGELDARAKSARVGIAQAEAELRRAKLGPRTEEIDQAWHRLRRAEAVLEEARKQLERTRILVAEGAIPRATLDKAEASFATAEEDVNEARSYAGMLKSGPRVEDVKIAEQQVGASKAALDQVLSGYAQLEPLRLQMAIAKVNIERALAAEDRIRQSIARTELRAPVAGVVTRLRVEKGAVATSGIPVASINTREDLHIEAEIGSEDTAKIRKGMPVTVTSPAFPGQVFAARLVSSLPVGEVKPDAAIRTRIVRARVELSDGSDKFLPGMEVDVEGRTHLKTALTVNSDAIVVSDRDTGVYVVRDQRVWWTPVRLGYASASQTEILDGLRQGDIVVVSGKENLGDGVRVREKARR
jgi:RND family efflux transporter MFP subunit